MRSASWKPGATAGSCPFFGQFLSYFSCYHSSFFRSRVAGAGSQGLVRWHCVVTWHAPLPGIDSSFSHASGRRWRTKQNGTGLRNCHKMIEFIKQSMSQWFAIFHRASQQNSSVLKRHCNGFTYQCTNTVPPLLIASLMKRTALGRCLPIFSHGTSITLRTLYLISYLEGKKRTGSQLVS